MTAIEEKVQTILKRDNELETLVTNRETLIKKRGRMVTVLYQCEEQLCFVVGWFFALNVALARFKVTSTRFDNYESVDIPVTDIVSIEDTDYQD